ncbi:membrane-spanning 4-domains subfamily A member 8 [Cricetulus griseus]|uniref:Membrane-spanning 4-domains subfamily A member 8 n=1 Tax=Cricetulus griseus TaxID=10029 RepID=A0A9J7JVV2_CRIGR|nr:membrane-spanning 4-domains subfamily A member 8 [Cricetulus griseus]XP_035297451.1 membrane-spanning 4-domains subfamily A member 8 [Cricetulus griseus]
MSSMPSPGPMANSVYVVAPHNGYPVVSGTVPQVPLYPNNQPQIHVIPGNLPVSVPTQKVLKNGKVLGAIQILIGLVHIGLGSIMLANLSKYYVPISLYGGFPFWGAIWFIISGSLSVAAENQPNSPCLMNGSVGLNIFSAICSAAGIILFITEMSVSGIYGYPNDYHYYTNWVSNTGMAISGVLLIFCILELCIASVSSHFGCQVTCCQNNNVNVAIPNVYATNTVVFPEPSNPMPSYSNVVQNSR